MSTSNTRTVRNQFRKEFSKTTAQIVQRIAKGKKSREIADSLKLSVGTVATTRANLTRGVYTPFAYMQGDQVVGNCQF